MEVLWLRRDVRLSDNAALCAAVDEARISGSNLCILFVYDLRWVQGQHCHASHCHFVAQGLEELDRSLLQRCSNAKILTCSGLTEDILACLHSSCEGGIRNLWTHLVVGDHELQAISHAVEQWCCATCVPRHELDQYGLRRDGRLQNGKSVFASSFEAAMASPILQPPKLADIGFMELGNRVFNEKCKILAKTSDWISLGVDGHNRENMPCGGESKALGCLNDFLYRRGEAYATGLSSPVTAWDSCSRLSAYLAWGHISLRKVVQTTKERQEELRQGSSVRQAIHSEDTFGNDDCPVGCTNENSSKKGSWLRSLQQFQSRLRWRTHFMQKLYDEPSLTRENMARGYDGMRQEDFASLSTTEVHKLHSWLDGRTGCPLVDACMRALHVSGWINFRMRCMLVSFASYHLWLSWKHFGGHLAKLFIDYEPGIHYPQLQMQSGTTGINSNRIYDPVKQLLDHDPLGVFTKQYVPELRDVPAAKLTKISSVKPASYPTPIWNPAALKDARDKLKAYNKRVKHDTCESAEVFQKHGSRRPNAGDLQKSVKRRTFDADSEIAVENLLPIPEEHRAILIEKARSSRSRCRCCKGSIDKDTVRCGLQVRFRARWETHWCHAQCFLVSCTSLTHCNSNREARCKGSGQTIKKGDLVVRFAIGDAVCTMLPASARTELEPVTKLVSIDTCKAWICSGKDCEKFGEEDFYGLLQPALPPSEPESVALSNVTRTFKRLRKVTAPSSDHTFMDVS